MFFVHLVKLQINAAVAVELPSLKDIGTTVSRQRKIEGVPKVKPTKLSELMIPQGFKQLILGSETINFLQFDLGMKDENRFLIFSTPQNLEMLKRVKNLYSDGTFATVPKPFEHLYSFDGLINNQVLPLVYAFLPNKKQATYVSVLSKLKESAPNMKPSTIMTDFEKAAINAYIEIFPSSYNQGCFFHLSQSIYRNLVENKEILERYKSEPEFARGCRMVAALAFVPVSDVSDAFIQLEKSDFVEKNPIIVNFLYYFEITYIGKMIRNTRKGALFPIE